MSGTTETIFDGGSYLPYIERTNDLFFQFKSICKQNRQIGRVQAFHRHLGPYCPKPIKDLSCLTLSQHFYQNLCKFLKLKYKKEADNIFACANFCSRQRVKLCFTFNVPGNLIFTYTNRLDPSKLPQQLA